MDGCNWNCELIHYLSKKRWLQVLVLKKRSILEKTRSLQVASSNNDSTTRMYDRICSFQITIRFK